MNINSINIKLETILDQEIIIPNLITKEKLNYELNHDFCKPCKYYVPKNNVVFPFYFNSCALQLNREYCNMYAANKND